MSRDLQENSTVFIYVRGGGVLIASEEFYDLASCCAFLEGYGGVVNMQDDDGNWLPLSNAGREFPEDDPAEPGIDSDDGCPIGSLDPNNV